MVREALRGILCVVLSPPNHLGAPYRWGQRGFPDWPPPLPPPPRGGQWERESGPAAAAIGWRSAWAVPKGWLGKRITA